MKSPVTDARIGLIAAPLSWP